MASIVVCTACGSDVDAGSLTTRTESLRRNEVDAEYVDCDELAGVGLVPRARVEGLVPEDYTILEPVPGFAAILVQGETCKEIRVGGGFSRPGSLAQFGVGVVPPLGTGQGDFYQLMFTSNHPKLVERLRAIGANAQLSRRLEFAFVDSSQLEFRVPRPRPFAWVMSGPITPPDATSTVTPEKAFNLWIQSAEFGNVLQENVVSQIRENGSGEVTLTAVGDELQTIVGAEPFSFAIFSDPETFDRARLEVVTRAF